MVQGHYPSAHRGRREGGLDVGRLVVWWWRDEGLLSDCVRCLPREHEASSLAWWWQRVVAGTEWRRSEE